jgi:hypothetical protein
LPAQFFPIERVTETNNHGAETTGQTLNLSRYKDVAAIMYGPLLLAGLTAEPTFALRAERASIGAWLHVEPGMRFEAPGNWSLKPLNRIDDEPYTAYFNVSATATG